MAHECLQGAQPQGQAGAGARPVLPPQPGGPRKRGRPPKQPMQGLAPPVSGGAAGSSALGKEAEDRRVRVWWPDDKVGGALCDCAARPSRLMLVVRP